MAREYLLERLPWTEAKQAFEKKPVVVIPTGSCEQHGPHMPVGTDFLIADNLANRLGKLSENVLVTPTLPIGYAKYHTTFPGTLAVSEQTLTNYYIEICEDLVKYGTTHILFVNGHGGNQNSIARCGAWLRQRGVLMALCSWWTVTKVANPEWLAIGHGDYVETAAILAVDEKLPRMNIAKIPDNKDLSDTIKLDTPHNARFKDGSLYVNLYTVDVTESGDMIEYGLSAAKDYNVPPTKATKDMGEKLLDGVAKYLAEFVDEFRKASVPPLEKMGPLAK